jgi:hypothetical protein
MTYRLREVSDVGIGNHLFFATEQHYKNKSNKNGIMTFNCQRTSEDGKTSEDILVKCTDIHPVLALVINQSYAWVIGTNNSMKAFLNKHIAASFAWDSSSTISGLQDNRYVLSACVCLASDKSDNTSTKVEIIFNRTEDAQMIMFACRAFFKQFERAFAPVVLKFPPPEFPMWVRLHYNLPDSTLFKKYRDSFSNWEVVDYFYTKKEWHYASRFTLPEEHVQFSAKLCVDGKWTKVLYAEYANLIVIH